MATAPTPGALQMAPLTVAVAQLGWQRAEKAETGSQARHNGTRTVTRSPTLRLWPLRRGPVPARLMALPMAFGREPVNHGQPISVAMFHQMRV